MNPIAARVCAQAYSGRLVAIKPKVDVWARLEALEAMDTAVVQQSHNQIGPECRNDPESVCQSGRRQVHDLKIIKHYRGDGSTAKM